MSTEQNNFNEAIDAGSAAISSFTDMMGDFAVKAKIKVQLLDQSLEYDALMKKLGEAVYDEIKHDERYTTAHQTLFTKIAEVAARKRALEDEYARVDAQNASKEQPQEEANSQQGELEEGALQAEEPKEETE